MSKGIPVKNRNSSAAIPAAHGIIDAMKIKRTKRNGRPDPAIVADLVRRIVEAADPQKIVLFGSAARGQMGPNSDYDLLVIKEGKFNHSRLMRKILEHLHGKEAPTDVVLVSAEDAERYRDAHCLVICPALREGKVIYDAQAVSAN